MKYELVTYTEFHLIGLATQLPRGNSPEEMGVLWQKFLQENIWAEIPHKDGNEIICLYTDYEGGYDAPMTAILGAKVSTIKDIPEHLVARKVTTATYARFVGKGAIPEVVGQTWHAIWKSDLEPAFTNSFEVYAPNQNPKNAKVDIYLAI